VGQIEHSLMEADGMGHTQHFAPIRVPGAARGSLIRARVTGQDGRILMAEAA
jgi:threonylcarbamoyladenosine tRNA methylthiotransferase MtaB